LHILNKYLFLLNILK